MNSRFVFHENTDNIHNYQIRSNNDGKTDMVLKLFYIDHLSWGQIYHKNIWAPSKEESDSGMVKYVYVAFQGLWKKCGIYLMNEMGSNLNLCNALTN